VPQTVPPLGHAHAPFWHVLPPLQVVPPVQVVPLAPQ